MVRQPRVRVLANSSNEVLSEVPTAARQPVDIIGSAAASSRRFYRNVRSDGDAKRHLASLTNDLADIAEFLCPHNLRADVRHRESSAGCNRSRSQLILAPVY
jgi:hypothetical protein